MSLWDGVCYSTDAVLIGDWFVENRSETSKLTGASFLKHNQSWLQSKMHVSFFIVNFALLILFCLTSHDHSIERPCTISGASTGRPLRYFAHGFFAIFVLDQPPFESAYRA